MLVRFPTEPDGPHLPRLLNSSQLRNGHLHNLLHRDKLDIVTKDDVQMIGPQTVETYINALGHTFG